MISKNQQFIFHDEVNGGPPLTELTSDYLTPPDLFFVRSHAPIPTVEPDDYRLTVTGYVIEGMEITLEQLKTDFEQVEITAALQCAGNRRQELVDIAPIEDQLTWGCEAIGNAVWKGVRLADVLNTAKVNGGHHVAFSGLDSEPKHGNYGSSIPLEKALAPEVLLAYEMNGQPLLPEHGYPVRVVVPGYIGARSVKWVSQISVQETPSANYYQQVAYQLNPPGVMLGELSVNAVITAPLPNETLAAGSNQIYGYAMGGRPIVRVDVSIDGGATWTQAELIGEDERWGWRLWSVWLDLPAGEHELIVRGWDSAANTQPESVQPLWNSKGYMNNAWHRVNVSVS